MEINESTILTDLKNLRENIKSDDEFERLRSIYLEKSKDLAFEQIMEKEMTKAFQACRDAGIPGAKIYIFSKSFFSDYGQCRRIFTGQ